MPGSFADTPITDPTLNASDIALLKGILTKLGGVAGSEKVTITDLTGLPLSAQPELLSTLTSIDANLQKLLVIIEAALTK